MKPYPALLAELLSEELSAEAEGIDSGGHGGAASYFQPRIQ